MNFDLADGIRMVDEVTKVGFRLKSLFRDPRTLLSVSVRHNIFSMVRVRSFFPFGPSFGYVNPCLRTFFENQTKNGRMSAGQAKTVKKVCKGNNDNCIAIAEGIFDKLQTKKIESKLSLLEMLDMLFLRSNSVRTYVLDNFGE